MAKDLVLDGNVWILEAICAFSGLCSHVTAGESRLSLED